MKTKETRLRCLHTQGFYVDVKVFPTRKAMRQWLTDNGHDSECEAMSCGAVTYSPAGRKTKSLGTVVFWKGFLGAGIVAHEMTHTAMRYTDAKGLNVHEVNHEDNAIGNLISQDAPEEILCKVVGNLVAQFWDFYYKEVL